MSKQRRRQQSRQADQLIASPPKEGESLTSRELGFLLAPVAGDAVRDLEGSHSPQGVLDVLGGPVRQSQVVNPLRREKNE